MRQKHKKILLAGTATTVAGVLGIGTLLTSHLSVQASPEMMPGIETIVEETSQEAPFRILEIVDDKKDAEMGWYVSGQEPYIKLYSYTDKDGQVMTFSTLEEGLAKLPTKELREQFARNITYEKDEKGEIIETPTFKDVSYASYTGADGTKEEDYPLSYTPYQEKYFLSNEDEEAQWNRIDFSEIRTVTAKGSYVENPAGTGNYTKEEQSYYPIREDNLDDAGQKLDTQGKEGLFRENIRNFLPSESPDGGGNTAYHLVFQAVENNSFNQNLKDLYDPEKKEQITQNPIWKAYNYSEKWDAKEEGNSSCYGYGYYENTYEALTARIMEDILPTAQDPEKLIKYTFPGENPSVTIETREIPGLYVPESKLFGSGEISLPQDSSTDEIAPFDGIEAIPDGDVFGDGSFGDGSAAADDFSAMSFSSMPGANVINLSFEETIPVEPVQNFDQEDTQIFQPEQGIENPEGAFSQTPDTSAENEEISNTVNEVLGAIAEKETAGTQKNPYIYIAEELQAFPYYRYRKVGDLQFIKVTAVPYNKEHPYEPNPKSFLNISIDKNGQYLYWTPDEKHPGNWLSQELFIVTGRQPVAYEDLHSLPVDENNNSLLYGDYYYKVVESYFCCRKTVPAEGEELKPEHYQFYGWYHPSFPENEPRYLTVEKPEEATYYISDAKYTYTPGKGDYDFVPDENGEEHRVEVDHLFYRGGYQNHDWLKQYVFHLKQPTDESSQTVWDKFSIQVDTLEANAQTTFSDGNSSTDEFTDNTFSDGTEAAVIDSSARQAAVSLEDYDLIYINGHLSPETANSIANANPFVPCIINQVRTAGDQLTIISKAFLEYIKQEDQDQHYVSQQVYFFKNTWQQEPDGDSASLLNLQFFKNFNPDAEQNGTIIDNQQTEGLEEILEYIEKENQYRQIGSTDVSGANTTGFTDGTETAVLSDGTSKNRIPLLDKTLSQARAIEYILNYRHKRNIINKESIRVLDLEPSTNGKFLGESDVRSWLGLKEKYNYTITTCCNHIGTNSGPIANMQDNDLETWWHSAFDERKDTHYHLKDTNKEHTITITMAEPCSQITGIRYTPKQDTNSNGTLGNYKINIYKSDNSLIRGITGYITQEQYAQSQNPYKAQILEIADDSGNLFERIKKIELTFLSSYGDVSNQHASCAELNLLFNDDNPIQITHMTTSEFVGHTEELNTTYDMIYIGASGRHPDKLGTLINGENNLLYTHTGGAITGKPAWQGLMNQDYQEGYPPVSQKGTLITENYEIGKVGSVRGSGNDITQQQVDAIKNYAESGYPIVISNNLFSQDTIDSSKVDNSSYMYQLLEELTEKHSYENVYKDSETKGIDFFINLPKPVIDFSEGSQPESAIGTIQGPSQNYLKSNILEYKFQIKDEAEVSPANARYHCQLFVDLNSDGNFSKTEELKDLQIQDSNGTYLSKSDTGTYALRLGESYTVSRQIPKEYYKLITWKLKVSNLTHPEIFATAQGYTKQKADENKLPQIKILQIYPDKSGNWVLQNDTEFKEYLNEGTSGEFTANIVSKKVSEYVKEYISGYSRQDNPGNILDVDGYDMLIIGFDDVYQNIPNQKPEGQEMGAVDAILKFVKDGKSVLFAHDTTSFVNVDMDNINNKLDAIFKDVVIQKRWGYSLNTLLRPLVGMDRYGITNTAKATDSSRSISDILKEAKELSFSSDPDNWNIVSQNGEMAYKAGSARQNTNWETHGYTNALLNYSEGRTTSARQINSGAITEYPFKIPPHISVAETHGQYYQLAMEEDENQDGLNDIIVWYCLSGEPFDNSPGDVRNNYYLYSKGNVMYTGVGHSNVGASGQTYEKKLFVNTIVAAYRAGVVSPTISFVEDFYVDAPKKEVEYYATDQLTWSDADTNIIDNKKNFFLTVNDENLISTDSLTDDARKLDLELFIESTVPETKPGTEYGLDGITKTVVPVLTDVYENNWNNNAPSKNGSSGTKLVSSGSVCAFTIDNLENYLKDTNGNYKNDIHIYAKVSKKMNYYGKEIEGKAMTSIALNQRQLFDLD